MNIFTVKLKAYVAILVVLCLLIWYAGFVRAPRTFPTHQLIVVEEGMSITEAAHMLESSGVIASSFFFSFLSQYFSPHGIYSGVYAFEKPLSVFSVWHRMSNGETGAPLIRVTIPEGSTIREMSEIFAERLPGFNSEAFKKLSEGKEGYLFPETYLFPPGISEEVVIERMEEEFIQNIQIIEEEIVAFGRPTSEVIIMASILEKEARLYETRQKVAGILWKRLDINMPLQVDAVFGYILNRDTFNPTFADLEIESPYNTYRNLGLPPGPIANPGLEAIRAAIHPIESPYLFYLTGSDGRMHYAETFEQHVANRRFLR